MGRRSAPRRRAFRPSRRRPDPLPFDHARAHKLYTGLFSQVQDLIKDKHLLIVPSGPLTQLPFQVLVARPPSSAHHRAAAWLQIPVHRGQSFRRIADSVPVIADSF